MIFNQIQFKSLSMKEAMHACPHDGAIQAKSTIVMRQHRPNAWGLDRKKAEDPR
ncbi:hypothetical protein [Candidatus Hepatobacter penaei]|uniref:hypothetical protein n=1 Tax=Candidatus Hepatobacter penaei TaxID=1274402 RepID=UPI0012E02F58|nr:hypothetical protein [Candidatus Hepatobacter penaei]